MINFCNCFRVFWHFQHSPSAHVVQNPCNCLFSLRGGVIACSLLQMALGVTTMVAAYRFTKEEENTTLIFEYAVPYSDEPTVRFFEKYGGYSFFTFFGVWMFTSTQFKSNQIRYLMGYTWIAWFWVNFLIWGHLVSKLFMEYHAAYLLAYGGITIILLSILSYIYLVYYNFVREAHDLWYFSRLDFTHPHFYHKDSTKQLKHRRKPIIIIPCIKIKKHHKHQMFIQQKRAFGVIRPSEREDPDLLAYRLINIWKGETIYQNQSYAHWQPRKFLDDRARWRKWMSYFFPDDFPKDKKPDLSKFEVVNEKNMPRPFQRKGNKEKYNKYKPKPQVSKTKVSSKQQLAKGKGKEKDTDKKGEKSEKKKPNNNLQLDYGGSGVNKSLEKIESKEKREKASKKEKSSGKDNEKKSKEQRREEKKAKEAKREERHARKMRDVASETGFETASEHRGPLVPQHEPKIRGKETHTSKLRATMVKEAAERAERMESSASFHGIPDRKEKKHRSGAKVHDSKSVILDAKTMGRKKDKK